MRLIDADALKKEIGDTRDGEPVFRDTEFIRMDIVEEAIDNAPTIKTFTLADIEEQYRKGMEKGLEESLEERENIISWLSKFCLHIDMLNEHVSDAEALEFWKKKMNEQFGWKESGNGMTPKEATECIRAIHVQMFNSGNSKWTEACDMAIEALKERKHGEWIFHNYSKNFECSNCHVRTELHFDQAQIYFENALWAKMKIYNFCPNCGASMRPETENVEE